MRFVIRAVTVAVAFCFLSSSAFAQRKKPNETETRVKNMETDIEVLQEFLQEQSTALQGIKTKLGEVDPVKEEVKKLQAGLKAAGEQTGKVAAGAAELGKQVVEERARIDKIEADLARKKVDFSGQIRVRPESRANQRRFNYELRDDNDILSGTHRARIDAAVRPSDWFWGKVSIQDARIWGSPTLFLQKGDIERLEGTGAEPSRAIEDRDADSALRAHEAFVDIEIEKEIASIRLGRQVWNFGAGRMVGDNDWEQAGRSFDGFDLGLTYENYIEADVLFSLVDERATARDENVKDLVFYGVYLTCPYVQGIAFDAYLLGLWDDRDTAVRKVGTLGGRAAGKLPMHEPFFFDIEGALQFGTVTEGFPGDAQTVDNSHFAVFVHADAGYALPVDYSPKFAAFVEYASGDGNSSPTDPKNDSSVGWVPFFPTRHAIFGPMDLFNQTNIIDFGGNISVNPAEEILARIELHSFHLYDDSGPIPLGGNVTASRVNELDTSLGTEIDFFLSWKLSGNLALSGGYSVFAPGATFKGKKGLDEVEPQIFTDQDDGKDYEYPREDPAHWAFLQADLTF